MIEFTRRAPITELTSSDDSPRATARIPNAPSPPAASMVAYESTVKPIVMRPKSDGASLRARRAMVKNPITLRPASLRIIEIAFFESCFTVMPLYRVEPYCSSGTSKPFRIEINPVSRFSLGNCETMRARAAEPASLLICIAR